MGQGRFRTVTLAALFFPVIAYAFLPVFAFACSPKVASTFFPVMQPHLPHTQPSPFCHPDPSAASGRICGSSRSELSLTMYPHPKK